MITTYTRVARIALVAGVLAVSGLVGCDTANTESVPAPAGATGAPTTDPNQGMIKKGVKAVPRSKTVPKQEAEPPAAKP